MQSDFLGLSWTPGKKVDYYKFRSPSDVRASDICDGAAACARGTEIFSSQVLHGHELTHSYVWSGESAPYLLAEGVAVALNCEKPNFANVGDWEAGFAARAR